MKQTLAIARKELSAYFGSLMALIFVGAFLVATLITFFSVEGFWARGIADVRPMFSWMPILMIFLVAALTMRQWSEEQRSGTLEVLMTLPVSKVQLVLGKFLAVMALVVLALLITLVLPITVAILGPLDAGPVVGGYLAALLMAAAYTAIGLFVSSRTDNQLVALILTVLLCGAFYLVGSTVVAGSLSGVAGDIARALGAGSRFESIQRGVIDLRDLAYYLSLTGIFLVLNVLSLDRKRWSTGSATAAYRRRTALTAGLLIANLAAANIWLYPLNGLRLDLTAGREYSLSAATRSLLAGLSEPLVMRAYISQDPHPLLKPLRPQVEDLLREYEIAGRGKVSADVVDPIDNPDVEAEANQTYGIEPTPLQQLDRSGTTIKSTYFDVLVRYGDQSEVLNFSDLIEVQPRLDGGVDVTLRNLEYDLTRALKKVVYGFQSVDALLASLPAPAQLTLFVTPQTLPEQLAAAPDTIRKVAEELAGKSNGKLTFQVIDPDEQGSAVTRQALLETYKLRPIALSFFSEETYYLDMVLTTQGAEGSEWQLVTPAGDLSEANIRTAIESSLKRNSSGFLKVIGLWSPPETPTQDMFGQYQQSVRTWQQLRQQLAGDYTVQEVDLASGQVPPEVDVLLVVSPQDMDDKARFAIDQYLMRGGSVIVAAGNYGITYDPYGAGLGLAQLQGGLGEMLAHYGVNVGNQLVMDTKNEPFPMPITRDVGGVIVQETRSVPFPFFVSVQPAGMDRGNPIVSKLNTVTLNFASPVNADAAVAAGRDVTVLLKSSGSAWLRTDTNIAPDPDTFPNTGFAVEGDRAVRPLAVAVQGSFESYFKGKTSPLAQSAETDTQAATEGAEPAATPTPAVQTSGVIEASPASSRLVVIGSADFLTDVIFQISSYLTPQSYQNSLQLAQNAVDWAVEDLDLLTIRARGTSSRILTLDDSKQPLVESLNYGLALLALVGIGLAGYLIRRREQPMALVA